MPTQFTELLIIKPVDASTLFELLFELDWPQAVDLIKYASFLISR